MKVLPLFALLLSSFCFADCFTNFSRGRDSATHQINVAYVDARSLEELSLVAIKKLSQKYGCANTSVRELKCRAILEGQSESEVCYIRSDLGYFIVNKDYMENLNVTFNRLD